VIAAADRREAADDYIELDFDHRHRRRLAMTSQSGKSFLLDLHAAVALADGDGLALDDGTVVIVRAKPERVAEFHANDAGHLARIAWHLGNRHLPTQILADRLRIRYDHVIVEMAEGLGAGIEITDAPFQPEGGAYGHAHER
jgi:urease accessory protein